MNGPPPSTRAFLCDLQCLPADSKIRFLGCVRQYNVTLGHLILEHNYPRSKTEASSVSVDINAVLETLTAEDLRVGTWLNVLGYVRDSTTPEQSFSSSDRGSQPSIAQSSPAQPMKIPPRPVYVDAIMVFPAGAIALGEYERILQNVQDVESRIHYLG
ncbi:uncharacterized protein N7483_001986 [Penicillium malachiteum]|uniref:uncharacterized protein n=1 Tax=Penicillium malachiteum TaxID=1324776 RepID=UPI002548D03C|nr:uncharacterized protein N7483_001986 [Penicillium malachiteum]KAJ5736861.1 hypothetical protein N7483_001986 [Penicillium malachiteum]